VEYVFGPYKFNVDERLLTRHGEPVHLTPKAAEVLLALLRADGRVVGKDDLIRAVWPDTFVEDSSLTFQIHLVRQAVRDGVDGERYIETVPRRGYRFVAPVRQLRPTESVPELPPTAASGQVPEMSVPLRVTRLTLPRWLTPLLIGGLAFAVALLGIWILSDDRSTLLVVGTRQLTHDRLLKNGNIPLLTDEAQIYFTPVDLTPRVVAVAGGETLVVPHVRPDARIVDVRADRSSYLAISYVAKRNGELWVVSRGGAPSYRIGPDVVDAASWSPDGTRITYANDTTLWVARKDGTGARQLAQFPGSVGCPRWSPDGRRLRVKLDTAGDRIMLSSLWEVGADGSHPHPLIPDWSGSVNQECGTWSKDGQDFIFSARDIRHPEQPGMIAPLGRYDLWTLPERRGSTRRPVQLTSGPMSFTAPVSSADGRHLFAVGFQTVTELVRFDARLNDFVPYLGGLSAKWINFSKDGKRIVYIAHPEGILWRSNIDGTEKRQLTLPPFEADTPAWSPDEKWVAIRGRFPGEHKKVYLIPAGGGLPAAITQDDEEQGIPTWSPDSARIAFGDVPRKWEQSTGAEVIHLYDINTHRFSAVPDSKELWTARWSPDGRYLAALTIRGQELRILDFQTGKWRSFTDDHVEEPVWSRDGTYVYHGSEGGPQTLSRLRVADDYLERLATTAGFPTTTTPMWTWSGLAFDDSPIVLRTVGATEVYALDVLRR
jgi:DNA-binding winged helix-turn-helix (wHTH) protein/Tol biopolymer transport system component